MFKLEQQLLYCTKEQFDSLTPEPGQIVIIVDDEGSAKEAMIWTGTEYSSIKGETNSQIQMTAYEINQQVIGQIPKLTAEDIENKKTLILDFCAETRNAYYMLLCRDINYFTLCHRTIAPTEDHNVRRYAEDDELISIDDLVIECAQNIGTIKAIEQVDGAIEIWITNPYGETHAMYFFPYDGGVEACQ